MEPFKAIAPTRAYQAVIQQLESAIVSGKLKKGDRLPPERELTEQLGTSRRTLREALRVLEQKGLVDIRLGSKGGAFVADKLSEKMGESLTLMIKKDQVTPRQLAEFRASTESAAAQLAAQRIGPEQIRELEDRLEELMAAMAENPTDSDLFVELEMALHLSLAESSGNPMYAAILKCVNEIVLYPLFLEDPIDEAYTQQAFSDWKRLIAALKKKDVNRARLIIESHIVEFNEFKGTE